ncbi:MAG: hypothetical protein NWE80_03270 [Candidatus Bathyarchaeota archaeon]|nr:hypothetical protein [Candidatus Bathyarchaeota archaeon]
MANLVQFNLNVRKGIFTKLNIELITWIANKLRENYNFDPVANVGQQTSILPLVLLKEKIIQKLKHQ